MQKVDPYEFVGVIVPGAVVVLGLMFAYPSLGPVFERGLSLGDLGLFLIVALIAGHLVQAIGNLAESALWWPFGGMPIRWPAKAHSKLLTAGQRERLIEAVKSDFGAGLTDLQSGRGLPREINAFVRRKGKTDRLESFNRQYGLLRGVACGFLVCAALIAIEQNQNWRISLILVTAAIVAGYRMARFGEHYARELFVEYLQCRENTAPAKEVSATK